MLQFGISYTVRYICAVVRSEKTRQFIIERTASIFNKKGYTGTYLSDLTEATGLTKGSIYGNFRDKNEVAVEAFRYNYRTIRDSIRSSMTPHIRSDQKLIAFLESYKTNHCQIFENGGCAILNTSVDADDGNIELRKEVSAALTSWREKLVEIMQSGIEKGELNLRNADDFALKMIAIIEGSIMMAKILNDPKILVRNMNAFKEEIIGITVS